MFENFRTYQLAVQFHQQVQTIKVPFYLRNQLDRASSSVVLNIAEGSGKMTAKDQRKFYSIALGSLRESVAVLQISGKLNSEISEKANHLHNCLFKLCRPKLKV